MRPDDRYLTGEDTMSWPLTIRRFAPSAVGLLAAAAGPALALLALPAPAHAGTYTIGNCSAAFTHSSTIGPWEYRGEAAPVKASCESEGGWFGFAAATEPEALTGFRVITKATHIRIVGVRAQWLTFGPPTGWTVAEIAGEGETGTVISGAAIEEDRLPAGGSVAGPAEAAFPVSDQVSAVTVGVRCPWVSGVREYSCSMQGQGPPLLEQTPVIEQINGLELTLVDEQPPTVALTEAPAEGSSVTGQIPVGFTASDEAGIAKAELLADGAPVATHDYTPACTYTQLQACPGSETDRMLVSSATLGEGSHQLEIRVTDVAGNTAISPARTVSVLGEGPAAGRPPSGSPPPGGQPLGTQCPDPKLTVTVASKTAVTIPFGARPTVTGRLACGQSPVAGAAIALGISTTAAVAPGPPATLLTAPDGSFSYQLPAGPDRTLSFSYRARSAEALPVAQTDVQISVIPRITLQITPRHTHNNATIHWSGRIEGGPYPVDGLPLLVQVKEGDRWQTFDEIVVHAGKIAYGYTFHRTTQPSTYSFRVALPVGGAVGYPYAAGASRRIRIGVR